MTNILSAQFPEKLRAMSMHYPYAWAIVNGEKKEEYRTRLTHYRGIVLIHASGSKDSDFELYEYGIDPETAPRKVILGAVELIDCQDRGDHFAYILQSPKALEIPINAAGQQSIFWPASTPERVLAFNQAWEQLQPIIIDPDSKTAWFM